MKFFGRNFQKGYVFVLVACMIPFFIMLSSLVIDLGRGYVYKSRLQNIADAAALAGAMQMEHSGVVHLVSDRPEDAVAETPTNEMISATNSSMESNNLSITDNVKIDRDLFEKDSKYYYRVAIRDYIPLLLAQKFLPDSFLPNGLPVTAYAWAALDEGENETDLFTQIYHIGETQTPKEFQDVNKILSNRAEKDIEDVKNMQGTPSDVGIKYNYSKDSNGNITVSRTETVTIRNFDDNTYYDGIKGNKYGNIDAWGWKYIYIEFQPDISISQNYAQIVDDKKYFPIMDWDVGDEFASGQSNIFRYDSVNINGTRKRHQSFNNIVNLLRDTYGLSKEEATEAVRLLLTSRIENIVPFNDVYKVRGKTKAELEYWEKKLSSSYTRTKEQQIADYNNNPYLAQLVARNIHDEICESDPLLVRIEGEDMDKELFGNNNIFYASSSRKFTFQINANNMSSDYRPLVIFYFDKKDDTVKVGLLHSLSGTMSLSEVPVRDAEKLAIEEINANGGVLGKKIEIVEEDGKSDPNVFAEGAEKLLTTNNVATIFGCWTSDSRKAVIPVVEKHNSLLWYPVQYEGFESSKNVIYTGSTLNQQIIPAIDYLLRNGRKKFFLLGSDYTFPKMANKVIKAQLNVNGGECVGEEYTPLGHTDYSEIIKHIKEIRPDVVINTLNGDANIGFFRQFKSAGITAAEIPIMSFSIAEIEIQYIGAENLTEHMTAWSYYETLDNEKNQKFASNYKKEFGNSRVTDDPMEAAYNSVYLWKAAVEKAKSFETDKVREALENLVIDSPEGEIKIDGKNNHAYRNLRIGKINGNGLIDTVKTLHLIQPDPYLESYEWTKKIFSAITEQHGVS